MTRLLFLDFDGVLHPTSAMAEAQFCQLPLLACCLAGADCHLVISSSWRHHYPLPELIGRFPPSMHHRFVGATGSPCFGRWPRHQEILAFVEKAAVSTDWRTLDDSTNEFPVKCPQLIACDPNRGFDVPQAHALRRWLAR